MFRVSIYELEERRRPLVVSSTALISRPVQFSGGQHQEGIRSVAVFKTG